MEKQRRNKMIANLKRNWYFPISALAFSCLYYTIDPFYYLCFPMAFLVALAVSAQIESVFRYCFSNKAISVLSAISAIEIILVSQERFSTYLGTAAIFQYIGWFGSIASAIFIYFGANVFWKNLLSILKKSGVFRDIKAAEWIVYGILLMISLIYMIVIFMKSDGFYGTDYHYDIIYTGDSPELVKKKVYEALMHPQNDLRQPLFAVFIAPIAAFPYLLSRLPGVSLSVQAILLNSVQILMLLTANLLLAKTLKLNAVKRICFMVLSFCTYTYLLFTLMMEQYIVAYFWLMICVYFIVSKEQPARIALWGAGGTLVSSMVLLPFMSYQFPIKDWKRWTLDMVKNALGFSVLLLVFCRGDVLWTLQSGIQACMSFTGKTVTFADKIFQYTEFLSNYFVAPKAGVNTTAHEYTTWQLHPVTGINLVGIIIFGLSVFSAIWNRDKRSSMVALGWVLFSVIILVVVGWGTKENGLIIYALYCGWPFFVLLFQLVEKIENKLKTNFIIPATTIVAVAVLLISNIPAIIEMVNFATTYYPNMR